MIKALEKYHMAKEKVIRTLRKQAFQKYTMLKGLRKNMKKIFTSN